VRKLYTDKSKAAWTQFAAAALGGITADPEPGSVSPEKITEYAATLADAMIEEWVSRCDWD
jgi:hypothetical protein